MLNKRLNFVASEFVTFPNHILKELRLERSSLMVCASS